jgi:hypothetical protein
LLTERQIDCLFRSMATLYLHIGMPKAGSSSIQSAFDPRGPAARERGQKRLADHRVGYFGIGRNHSAVLTALFGTDPERKPLHRFISKTRAKPLIGAEAADFDKSALLRYFDQVLAANNMPKLVMSGEMLFGFRREQVAAMREHLSRFFDEIRVIVYVRDPISWASSNAQQVLKNSSRTLDDICELEAIAAGDSSIVPYYRAGLEPYLEAYGRQAVDIRLFDRSHFINGDLIADFCAAIGEPSLASSLTGAVRNPSLCYEAVLLVDEYKALLAARSDQALSSKVAAFHKRMKSLEGTRFALPRETLESVWVAVADDVAWLRQIMNAEVFKDTHPPEAAARPAWATTTLRQLVEMIDQASDGQSPKPALRKSRRVAPPVS